MNIPACKQCGLIVLEAEGQFEKLDSYYISDQDGPARESVGYWHTSCLGSSPFGAAWQAVRVTNHIAVRDYHQIARTDEWTVVRHPRSNETLAFSRMGQALSLSHPAGRVREVAGGIVYRVKEDEYNLHLDDSSVILQIQKDLLATKTFPIRKVFQLLDIDECIFHPEALDGGLIHFSRQLRRDWDDTCVAARWEYGVFMPTELVQFASTTR
jgi:hypothetical protein